MVWRGGKQSTSHPAWRDPTLRGDTTSLAPAEQADGCEHPASPGAAMHKDGEQRCQQPSEG